MEKSTVKTKLHLKDTVPIFRAEFGNSRKWPQDRHNEVNDIVPYGVQNFAFEVSFPNIFVDESYL